MSAECECEEQKCPEGIPAWVMTFADLMSLLLAFFVLLFSFSEIDKQAYKQMAGSMEKAFGVQREVKAKEPPKGINIIAQEFSPGRTVPTPDNQVRQMTVDENNRFPENSAPGQKGEGGENGASEHSTQGVIEYSVIDEEVTRETMERIRRVENDSELIEEELSDEIKRGLIELEVKEQKIILRIREKGSFPSGSAEIIKPFKYVADKIADVFQDFEGDIIVSGHTDNIPIHTKRFRSNWELSASRAVSVIHELKKQPKLKNKHFQVEAFADTRPLESNKTWKGRAKNRRVEIKLSYENIPIDINAFDAPEILREEDALQDMERAADYVDKTDAAGEKNGTE